MKKFFGLFILALVISFATLTSCNQTPANTDVNDSTSISATMDTTFVVDSTAVDTSLLK